MNTQVTSGASTCNIMSNAHANTGTNVAINSNAAINSSMFCYQCEQAADGTGCNIAGICGKNAHVSTLQDLLIHALKGLAYVARLAEQQHVDIDTTNIANIIYDALFTTVTNVDFDANSNAMVIRTVIAHRDRLLAALNAHQKINCCHTTANMHKANNVNADNINVNYDASSVLPNISSNTSPNILPIILPEAATFTLQDSLEKMIAQGYTYKLLDQYEKDKDIQSLKNTLLFGIKGIAAYANHAAILGKSDESIARFMETALANMLRYDLSMQDWLALVLECGKINLRAMELLDAAHTEHFGHPTPTAVSLGHKQGKAILVSGHDLRDLELLLQQTIDKDIYIYTHGEMLPAHGYPELQKYPHLCGHYGTAWQNQHQEFASFPGAILMTTNCIQKPLAAYKDRIFTTGLVAWSDVVRIDDFNGSKDFSPVIACALQADGYADDGERAMHVDAVMHVDSAERTDNVINAMSAMNSNNARNAGNVTQAVTVGFAHNAVLNVAGKVIELVKSGKIRHFFLVAGCDGAKPGRNYYTEFVEKVPQDCVVLTLACGKFRFFDKDMGNIDGIPRLLDIGQCNDAYSAIQIALALAQAFGVGVNELPLSLVLSWYEQKAVAILLTLLALGIKNIRLGPSLPAFITPNVLQVLVDTFNIQPITTPENDLQAILGADDTK